MNLVFAVDGIFFKNSNGEIYSSNGNFTLRLWERYMKVFSSILILARVKYIPDYVGDVLFLANSDKVKFIELPYYRGPKAFLIVRGQISRIMTSVVDEGNKENVYLCRLPGTIGGMLINILRRKRIPYGCEIVGDPWDVYSPTGIQHPLRPFLRYYFYFKLKAEVKNSDCTLYVTQNYLQNRYPSLKDKFQISVSDVLLPFSRIANESKIHSYKDTYNLISIGSLSQMYKSPDIVIKTIYDLKIKGIKCILKWLGDGKYRRDMELLSQKLNIQDQVLFLGNVTADEVIQELRKSDIFVLVSRTEGLPRALIEAMAQGMPCIGSKVGGIPELLDSTMLVRKNSVRELSDRISQLILNPIVFNEQANNNLQKAMNFQDIFLEKKRISFYEELIRISKMK